MRFAPSIWLPILAALLLVQGCAAPPKAALPAPVQLYTGPPAHRMPPLAAKAPAPRPPLMQPSVPHDETAPSAAPVDAVAAEPAPAAPPTAAPTAPDESAVAAPADLAPTPATPTPPAPAPTTQPVIPTTVVGLSEDEVRARLGAPAATTDSGPAQTWTYRTDGCSLYIAFFFDVTRNGFYALSERANGANGEHPACLARLAAAHAS